MLDNGPCPILLAAETVTSVLLEEEQTEEGTPVVKVQTSLSHVDAGIMFVRSGSDGVEYVVMYSVIDPEMSLLACMNGSKSLYMCLLYLHPAAVYL